VAQSYRVTHISLCKLNNRTKIHLHLKETGSVLRHLTGQVGGAEARLLCSSAGSEEGELSGVGEEGRRSLQHITGQGRRHPWRAQLIPQGSQPGNQQQDSGEMGKGQGLPATLYVHIICQLEAKVPNPPRACDHFPP
jgi:hypothetical protein